jgi:hypothetical protein
MLKGCCAPFPQNPKCLTCDPDRIAAPPDDRVANPAPIQPMRLLPREGHLIDDTAWRTRSCTTWPRVLIVGRGRGREAKPFSGVAVQSPYSGLARASFCAGGPVTIASRWSKPSRPEIEPLQCARTGDVDSQPAGRDRPFAGTIGRPLNHSLPMLGDGVRLRLATLNLSTSSPSRVMRLGGHLGPARRLHPGACAAHRNRQLTRALSAVVRRTGA